jgi:hypothetical protein
LAQAEEPNPIPKKVLKELDFMVGKWETEMTEDGVKVGKAFGERKWSPGKYCLTFTWSMELKGKKMEAIGISGWNVNGKAVVEHWYGSDGSSLTVRYPIRKMKSDAWEGTHRLVEADGKETKGKCRLDKGDDQWIYTVESEVEGKKITSRNVTRKVKE